MPAFTTKLLFMATPVTAIKGRAGPAAGMPPKLTLAKEKAGHPRQLALDACGTDLGRAASACR